MKISLNQSDLNAAVANHVTKQLGFPEGTQVDATFSLSGKNRDIVSADVEIYLPGQSRPEPVAKAADPEAAPQVASSDDGVFGAAE